MASVVFHPESAEGNDAVRIDLSAVEEGYRAVSAKSEKRLKFQVIMEDWTYTYNIASDGTPSFFPLQCGEGFYSFRVMENVEESKYVQIYRTDCEVELLDEFQPFLRPSDYSRYDEDSECVSKVAELVSVCSSKLEFVSQIYSFVCRHIRYDYAKAASVDGGQLPVFEIMKTTTAIANMIREDKLHQLESAMQAGAAEGMCTMDGSLLRLYRESRITRDTALLSCVNYESMAKRLGM